MQDIRNLITDEEKSLIEYYISSFACESDAYYDESQRASVDNILKVWRDNKTPYLSSIFGDKLIVSEKVSFTKPEEALIDAYYSNENISTFREEYYRWLDRFTYGSNENFLIYRALRKLISAETIVQNKFIIDFFDYYDNEDDKKAGISINTPNGHKIILNEGAKPVKMLGKLNNAFHISENFEKFRIEVSMLLNVKKISGNLSLSIHPLDYMTMSDNDCNWESCMSWRNYGSYRQGTVEMMNSPYVVVAYLSSETPMRFFDKEWNNKKWRSLYVVHPDFIGNIKGYPYQIPELDKIVINKLKKMIAMNFNCVYGDVKEYSYDKCFESDHGEVNLSFFTNYMYNDFGALDSHYGCVREDDHATKYIRITYSGPYQCMICGNTNVDILEEGKLICANCDTSITCDDCGRALSEDEVYYTHYGTAVCEECLSSYYIEPINDLDEFYYKDDVFTVTIIPDEIKKYIESNDYCFYNFSWDRPFIAYAGSKNHFERDYLKESCHVSEVINTNMFKTHYYICESEIKEDAYQDVEDYVYSALGFNKIRDYYCSNTHWNNAISRKEFLEATLRENALKQFESSLIF